MSVNAMVSAAVGMKMMAVSEQISYSVAKMALDRMEQTGEEVTELMEAVDVSLDPSLGNYVDISV